MRHFLEHSVFDTYDGSISGRVLKMNGKPKKQKSSSRTKVRFEGENTPEDHTDSSSTTSAEGNTVRPASYIVAEREKIEKAKTSMGVSSVSSSVTDRGKF